jgi:beta-mannosidase
MDTPLKTDRRILQAGWRVREIPQPGASPATALPALPAEVPGYVHLDLMRAGVIGDVFYRMMERSAGWVDEADWQYETAFTVDEPPEYATLIFHGLDTAADVTLPTEPLGHADNMFVPHAFPVGGRLKKGENVLQITLHSALRVGRKRRETWAESGNETMKPDWFMWGSRSFVRKAQYMYGWDWGPEPVSGGVWKPVELVTVPVARLLDWRHAVEFAEDGSAAVRIEANVDRAPASRDAALTLTAALAGVHNMEGGFPDAMPTPASVSVPPGEGRVSVSLDLAIAEPRRWAPPRPDAPGSPLSPALYDLVFTLEAGDATVDEKRASIGLRTVDLVREPDPDGQGESFLFRVNGEGVFMKGANWIPMDSFPSRADGERLVRLLTSAREAGVNMLRVWGGGLYESNAFYDLCDRLGILVWQDFPYACAYYPDTGAYADAAREEAARAIRRLRNHASLAVWCGNNENAMMHYHRWAGDNTPARELGEHIYHQVLPEVLAAEDPSRPYWPSSPYGGPDPNGEDFGDRHNWNVWHSQGPESRYQGDWPGYQDDRSRFVSEFGFASSCGLAAWNACLSDADKNPWSPAVRWHDKTRKGYETYMAYVAKHFPEPQTLEDLVYFSQINQAEALKFGVEHWRRLKGRCWGTLYWQYNDCWPVQSWSVVDYAGEPKAAWYATKRFYAPVLLSLVRSGNFVEAHLTNDLGRDVPGTVTVAVQTFDGEAEGGKKMEASAESKVGANATQAVARLDLSGVAGRERDLYVYASFTPAAETAIPPSENFLLLAEPKDLRLADPGINVRIERAEDGLFAVTVSAKRFAPYVWLRLNDHPDDRHPGGRWSDNFFHLRPGQSRRLTLAPQSPTQSVEDALSRLTVRTL